MDFGIGFGSGMLREQDRISSNRMQFASQMAQLIAQNPDLDVQGLMSLINGAAGTDNTLRGVYSPKTLGPYVEGRDRAKAEAAADRAEVKAEKARATRLQTYNAMQQWLQSNPGASMADAQNAFMMFSGGTGQGDPQMLSGFLDQAKRQQADIAKREKEANVGKLMQYRGQFEQDADRILAENDYDPYKAQVAWQELYGSDNMYGWNPANYITEERANKLRNSRIANMTLDVEKRAGENGNFESTFDLLYPDVKGPERASVLEYFGGVTKKREEEKVKGLNMTLSDSGAMKDAASIAAVSKSNPDVAWSSFVYKKLGISPEQAEAQGVNIKAAKSDFDALYKFAQDEYGKKTEAENIGKRSEIQTYWTSDYNLPVALDYLKRNDRPGFVAKIMQTARENGATNFTEFDAMKLIDNIASRTTLAVGQQFAQKGAQIEGDVYKVRDDMVKKSKDAAKLMFDKKEALEARGLKDPAINVLLYGLAEEFDFANPQTAAKVDEIITAWASEGGGNTNNLVEAIRNNLTRSSGDIGYLVDADRQRRERETGRFGLDAPQTVDEFKTSFTSSVDEDVSDLKSDIEKAKGFDLNDPNQLAEAVDTLEKAKTAVGGMRNEITFELAARQKNTDWLKIGQSMDPAAYKQLAKSADQLLMPYAQQIDQLLAAYEQKAATIKKSQQQAESSSGPLGFDVSKLPIDVQVGYVAKPQIPIDASSGFGRGLQSMWNVLNGQYANAIPGSSEVIGDAMSRGNTYTGGMMPQSPEEFQLWQQVNSILTDPQYASYIERNPIAYGMLNPNNDSYDPEGFVKMFKDATRTKAAPPQQ